MSAIGITLFVFTAMYIVFRNYEENKENPFKDPAESIMGMFMMSLGEFGDYYENFEKTEHPILSKVNDVVFDVVVDICS